MIITDIKMPKVDGYSLIRELKKDSSTQNIPIIVYTAYERMAPLVELEGIEGFVLKAGDRENLIAKVYEVLERRGLSKF